MPHTNEETCKVGAAIPISDLFPHLTITSKTNKLDHIHARVGTTMDRLNKQ
jgi:hypothetical protein